MDLNDGHFLPSEETVENDQLDNFDGRLCYSCNVRNFPTNDNIRTLIIPDNEDNLIQDYNYFLQADENTLFKESCNTANHSAKLAFSKLVPETRFSLEKSNFANNKDNLSSSLLPSLYLSKRVNHNRNNTNSDIIINCNKSDNLFLQISTSTSKTSKKFHLSSTTTVSGSCLCIYPNNPTSSQNKSLVIYNHPSQSNLKMEDKGNFNFFKSV